MNPDPPLLLVIAGPTASGKTAIALALAQKLKGEIISCDSVAVYRGMDIGSAKPTPAQRALVPHQLIDIATPDIDYSAGEYGRAARKAAHAIAARGRLPIVVGGTGLYLRALIDGLSALRPRDEALRSRIRDVAHGRGSSYLHRLLAHFDADAAARIHINDTPKVMRAIELNILERNTTADAWQTARPEPLTGFRIRQFGLAPPRAELYRRIDSRCTEIFHKGLIEEMRSLEGQYGPNCRAFNALGYAQAQAVLRGSMTEAEALLSTQQGHRNYAKRQGTWFRKDPRIEWLPTFGEEGVDRLVSLL